jgi:hypothetical protein
MGFLGSLGESLRAHVDERVRSPFAGAFVVAWVAINWQAVLILTFSSKSIEERIEFISKNHLSTQDTVWYPLGLAAAIAIGFYFSSASFSILAELYASVESLIAKFFDRIKWVSPEAYIQRVRWALVGWGERSDAHPNHRPIFNALRALSCSARRLPRLTCRDGGHRCAHPTLRWVDVV